MANIQSTQYANPDPGQGPAWAQFASGFLKGGAGQISMQQQQQMAQDEENRKAMAQIAVAFANNGQLAPGQSGDPNGFMAANRNWSIQPKPFDPKNFINTVEAQALLNKMRNGPQSQGQPQPTQQQAPQQMSAAQQLFSKKPPMFLRKVTGQDQYGFDNTADMVNPDYQAFLDNQKGLTLDAGRLAMVKQAQTDIQGARKMLFPDGTPQSFDRMKALKSNIPGSRAPVIGAIIPQVMPFSKDGQEIYSRLQNAVAAKLRMETGAAAAPSEVEDILARFGVTSMSNPQAAWDALDRLEQFMNTTVDITDPAKRFSGAGESAGPDPALIAELKKRGKL